MQPRSLIKPAEYARLRGLNRSTISKQIAAGVIPAHEGLVDPVEADRARDRNLNYAKRRNVPLVLPSPTVLAGEAGGYPARSGSGTPARGRLEGAPLLAYRLRTFGAVTDTARFALRIGCTPEQVVLLDRWFGRQIYGALSEGDVAALDAALHAAGELDFAFDWERVLGVPPVSFEESEALFDALTKR